MMEERVSKKKLVADLEKIGVQKGDLLNIKASLKSIGMVDGGAPTLVEALLEAVGETGTIVTDSFVKCYPLWKVKRDQSLFSDDSTPSYAGALANAMINHPRSVRSRHPIQKFSAIGLRAEELMMNHTPDSYAYDVLRIMAENGGKNLKIGPDAKVVGVGTTHVAIGLLGFRERRPRCGINFIDQNGQKQIFERNWASGCGIGFNNFIPLYYQKGAVIQDGLIGSAESKLTEMKRTLAIEIKVLKSDPTFFMCKNPKCVDCRLSWQMSSGNIFSFLIKNWLKMPFLEIGRAIFISFLGSCYPTNSENKISKFI